MTRTTIRAGGYSLVVAAFTVSILVAVILAFAPMVTSVSESAGVTVTQDEEDVGETERRTAVTHETLPEAQGWGAVAAVGVPLLLLTGLPLLIPWPRAAMVVRAVSTFLLFAGVLLGALSFGIFYLPAAVLMLIATILAFKRTTGDSHRDRRHASAEGAS